MITFFKMYPSVFENSCSERTGVYIYILLFTNEKLKQYILHVPIWNDYNKLLFCGMDCFAYIYIIIWYTIL